MGKHYIVAFYALLSFLAVSSLSLAASGGNSFHGTAYIQGHGGHVVVLDLETGALDRIQHGKPSDALSLSGDNKTLYIFSLDGHSAEINLINRQVSEWTPFGKKHCGSAIAPDGMVWVSDMKDGHIYVYDPKTRKLADKFEISRSTCSVDFSKDGRYAYVGDMPGGYVSIVDVAKRTVVGKISNVGEFIHRGRVNPSGTEFWQSNGRELRGGEPFFAEDNPESWGNVAIIDLKRNKIKKKIRIGGNPHDVSFSPDGKHAFVAARQLPVRNDSSVVVVSTETGAVLRSYPVCLPCHSAMGVTIPRERDDSRAFLCAVDIAWRK